jgi:hypothetical protein
MDHYLSSDTVILDTLMRSLGLPAQVGDNDLLLALLLQPEVSSMQSSLQSTCNGTCCCCRRRCCCSCCCRTAHHAKYSPKTAFT